MLRMVVPLTPSLKTRMLCALRSSTPKRKPFSPDLLVRGRSSSAHCSLKEVNSGRHFEEISIPVPWGHLAGKWYGPMQARPIIGLHGWQDNAGTYDTLAPLLTKHVGFLSLDLPGHGRSSWLPSGMSYHSIDYVLVLLRIMDYYKWGKISMICHSMSAINGFVFSALFPDKVDMIASFDNLKPLTRSSEQVVNFYSKIINDAMKHEERTNSSKKPCYDWDQLVERLHNGTNKSVKMEMCKYLLNRAIQPSMHEPHKYFFSRDDRLKTLFLPNFSNEVTLDMARRIRSPYLFIKALNAQKFEPQKNINETLHIMRQNPFFEYHEVEGSHHVHLNEPEKVAPIINSFINKWRPTKGI